MHIFIDESGQFIPTDKGMQWSSVGAFVVPNNSLKEVELALNELKIENNICIDQELKNRPDSDSPSFLKFINRLKELNCTLHVSSTTGGLNQENDILQHKNDTLLAIKDYLKITDSSEDPHANSIIDLIKKMSLQQYNQCITQIYMIHNLIGKVLALYSSIEPSSLANFVWEIDRKEISKKIPYDHVFENLYLGLIGLQSARTPWKLPFSRDKNDISYFLESFGIFDQNMIDESLREKKELYRINLYKFRDYLRAFKLNKLLTSEFSLEDSATSFGIQTADLLISSVNRCLKNNFTDNKIMATELGSIMVEDNRENQLAIVLSSLGEDLDISETSLELVNLMNDNSIKVYNINQKQAVVSSEG